jgi:hypothetical protein
MSSHARRFYLRYYLRTRILPVYLLALLSYSLAWVVALNSRYNWDDVGVLGGTLLIAVLLLKPGISQLLGGIGFLSVMLPGARSAATPQQVARLTALLPPDRLPLKIHILELGEVLFLGADLPPAYVIWISSHAYATLSDATLRAMLYHEAGHSYGWLKGCAWEDTGWALALPVAFLLEPLPLLILAAALVHAQLWLHLQQWLREREEARADIWAMQRLGRREYTEALAGYLAHFEQGSSSALRRGRLSRMGLNAEEIDSLVG